MSTEDSQPIPADMPPVQQFAARAVRGTLGRSTDVDACISLVGQVDRLLEQAAQHLPQAGASLACRVGCNFCCHLQVRVLPHEAIALFRYLQSRMAPATADRVRTKIGQYAHARQVAGDAVPRRPCAFLIEGECSAYEVRPSACAAYHSVSRQRCEQSFHDPSLPCGTVALEALMVVALALEEGVNVALQDEGLSHTPIELHTAVAALLANPALIARWRAGQALLKSPPSGAV